MPTHLPVLGGVLLGWLAAAFAVPAPEDAPAAPASASVSAPAPVGCGDRIVCESSAPRDGQVTQVPVGAVDAGGRQVSRP